MDKPKNPYNVQVGQIWQDWDSRYRKPEDQRLLRVIGVGEEHALLIKVNEEGEPQPSILRARERRILLSRMTPNSTGYKLREDLKWR